MNEKNNNEVRATITLVTPEIASEWLKRNTNNRKLKQKIVESYAMDMINNRWSLNNDAITFDKSGILTNGQHRLKAVVKSRTSQYMSVMYGIEHNVNMDRPVQRSVSDNLAIFTDLPEILTKPKTVGIANLLRKFTNDNTYNSKGAYDTYHFIKEHKDTLSAFLLSIGTTTANAYRRTKFTTAPVLTAFYVAYCNGIDIELLKKMRHSMITGEYVYDEYERNKFLPMVKLDKAISTMSVNGSSAREDLFLRTMYAIYSVVEGKNSRRINIPAPEIYYDFEYKGKKLSTCFEARRNKL